MVSKKPEFRSFSTSVNFAMSSSDPRGRSLDFGCPFLKNWDLLVGCLEKVKHILPNGGFMVIYHESAQFLTQVGWLKPTISLTPLVKNMSAGRQIGNLVSPHFGINNPNIFTKPSRRPRFVVPFCWDCKKLQHSLFSKEKNQRKKVERMMVPEKSLTWNHTIKPEPKNHPDPSTFITLGSQPNFFWGK